MTAAPAASTAVAMPQSNGRNMLAVASGKGGVGKTWFAISLAHAMAKRDVKTLLFDGDLGLANLDIQLGLMPKRDLGGVIAGRLTLNQAVVPFEEGGFDIIAGRSGSGSLANIPLSRLRALGEDLTLLGGAYDKVIVDLGAGLERTVRQLTHSVNSCLVIATDDPASLTDAYAFIKVTHMEQPAMDIRIIINMAGSIRGGERTYNTLLKACEGFLKISPPLTGIIRNDSCIREAIRNQSPLLTRYPNCEAAGDVKAIAERLLA
ncbi:MinD/ParA family protein [Shumkonia mesophila]|uniref:MinD/ParA family protein n=1 Tax=Shumkonia mesophila TaxID=2838854 RepID=UPI002934309C|nr:MinD/ParA family protein [Shumkonia mesophila]